MRGNRAGYTDVTVVQLFVTQYAALKISKAIELAISYNYLLFAMRTTKAA